MSWDFETDPDFQRELDWMDEFVREEIEPLDFIVDHPNDFTDPNRAKLIPPWQEQVKQRGLWACHLGPDLGGQGYGQVKLGLMNEILGRAKCAPVVFGCQAPDSGNAEILAHYGTIDQKERGSRHWRPAPVGRRLLPSPQQRPVVSALVSFLPSPGRN